MSGTNEGSDGMESTDKPQRAVYDRRAGWGPQCSSHETTVLAITRLEDALKWIKIFTGGLLAVSVPVSLFVLGLMVAQYRATDTILKDHDKRLAKLEERLKVRSEVYPLPRHLQQEEERAR